MARIIKIDSIEEKDKYFVNYSVIDEVSGFEDKKQLEFNNKESFKNFIQNPSYNNDGAVLALLVKNWLDQDKDLMDATLINNKTLSSDTLSSAVKKEVV